MKQKAQRRVKGEGSIVQLPNGTFKGRIDLGTQNGKRVVKCVSGKSRKEVSDRMKELRREIELGKDPFAKKQRLEEFLERWMEKKSSSCRESTLRSYRLQIDRHIVPALGHLELTKVSAAHIDRMLSQKEADGLSGNSRRIIRCVLHGALQQAFKWDLIAQNPVLRTDAPKIIRKETEFLNEEQATEFVRNALGSRHGLLYVTALFTGLRKGEILGLLWEDVDFEAKTLIVSKQLQRVKGRLELVRPKTDKSCRTVPLPDFLVGLLKDHKAKQLVEGSMIPEWKYTGHVFTTTIGTPLDPRNASKDLKPILEAAKLPNIRFHDLRHSNATLMLAHGADLKTVMDHLGHNQIALTANLYGHRVPRLAREAADRLGSLFAI